MTIFIYENIYEKICSKTKFLIEEEKWEELEKLFRISPKQISLFSQHIEEKIKTSQLFTEPPLKRREYETETNRDYYSYNLVFWLSLEILKKDSSFFTQEFKKEICSIIFSFMKENIVNSAACERFAQGLHEEIRAKYQNELVEVPNLLTHLIKIDPDIGINLYSEITERGCYDLGFNILRDHPNLIETHQDVVKKIFQNIILNNTQYHKFTPPLIELYPELKQIIEEHRIQLKYEYYYKLIHPELDQVDKDWLIENQRIFSFCFKLYNEDELNKIIKRLVDLKIEYSYDNRESQWIILSLLEIGWSRKREFFDDYIQDLADLKYYQVVRDYFFQFPEKIKDNQDLILKINYFSLDLLEKKLEYFKIDNPVILFKDFLFKQYNFLILKRVFYQQYKDLVPRFNDEIEKYLNQIDVSSLDSDQEYIIYYVDQLLEILYGYYSNYVPDFDIEFFQDILNKFLSVDWIAKNFNPITSLYIPRNFENFELDFQEKIINLLLENNKLTCLDFFLNVNFNAFEPHLDKILDYEPREPLESIHLAKVISKIVKKSIENQEVSKKAMCVLQDLELCPEKVQLFVFLGNLERSREILEELLDREEALPYAINLSLELNSILCELAIKAGKSIDHSILIRELANLKTQIVKFSSDTTTLQNFTFKKTNLEARLYLYCGFVELQNNNDTKSIDFFEKATNLLNELKSTKVIKKTTRIILEAYYDISIFFKDNVTLILEKLKQSVEEANQYLEESLNLLFKDFDRSNIQNTRIFETIQNLRFEASTRAFYQINYEIPTKFCPKPPLITEKTLYNVHREVIQTWNEKNETEIDDPIHLGFGYNKMILVIEFKEKEKHYDFNLEFKDNAFLDAITPKIEHSLGKISFIFDLHCTGFDGLRDLKFQLKENDLCGFNLDMCLKAIFESYASLEDTIIYEIVATIQKFKDRTPQYSDYKIFLDQFKDPYIRSGVLKYILKRIPKYYLTISEMIVELKLEVQKLHYNEENDDLIFCILNQLEMKSPTFCQYLVQNYTEFGRYKIETRKSKSLLKSFAKNPPSKNTHVIFLDDTIGSGSQFVKYYNTDFKPIYKKYSLETNNAIKFYLIASKGSYESIKYISQNTILEDVDIHYCKILRDSDKAFNSRNWQDDQLLEKVKAFLKQKDEKYWNGYKEEGQENGLEYLVINEWTVPNNTIGCLWNQKGDWKPLFPRA